MNPHELSKRDCIAMLQMIHFCASAKGGPGEIEAVFDQLNQLMPIDAAIVATGRQERTRIVAVDRMHSHGPNAWLSPYRDSEMEQVDPVVRRALEDDAPFRWSDANLTHATSHAGYQSLKRDAGRHDGVAAAFRGQRHAGRVSLISVALAERRIAKRHMGIVGYVLPHIHEMLIHTDGVRVQLTARELEVLRWVVAGKTNWEIGKILAVSERTAKFHLGNAFVKLGAVNRSQAVAKALRLGLLCL